MNHRLAIALPTLLLAAGCVIEDYGEVDAPARRYPRRVQETPAPEAKRERPAREYREHGPACADLEAAAGLASERKRADALEKIADRRGLSAHEQVHLVDLAVDALENDRHRLGILERLARARDLQPDARLHLARRLKEIPGDTDRVTEALLRNPSKAPPSDAPTPPTDAPVPPNPGALPLLGIRVEAEGAAVVTHVDPKGPAGSVGLQSGDRIFAVNDWEVTDLASLRNGLKSELEVKKADELWLKVDRGGVRMAFAVKAPR